MERINENQYNTITPIKGVILVLVITLVLTAIFAAMIIGINT